MNVSEQMDRIARFFDREYAGYIDDQLALSALADRTGGPILELGCGTGRALIPLAREGYQVTGVEASPAMLARARDKAEQAGVASRVHLIEGDFSTADLGGPYRLAFTLMNTFLHLNDMAAQISALKHWRQALAPRGLLLIDIFNPDVGQLASLDGSLEWEQTWTDYPGGVATMKFLARTVDPATQLMAVNHIYDEIAPDGAMRRTVAAFTLRYIWRYEAELLLDKAGFILEEVYGDWDLAPFFSDSERMILLARRSGRK